MTFDYIVVCIYPFFPLSTFILTPYFSIYFSLSSVLKGQINLKFYFI